MWVRIFCWSNISKGETPKARRKTARKYRYSYRMGPAFAAGQFVRAASNFCCGLPRIRSPASRRDVVRPLEKETVRFP